ncbi:MULTISPECIES: TIGR04149 family rSAM-modified RiPP [Bacteroidales]|uniref:RSAM-modified peptide n=1 Tax=Tannerella forsythia TaxID=28112 RepID=A0A3P1XL46_TANFO|nr:MULTISPECIES: TIGR04149 family rSAM-modified RiPP [Bacteroidales]ATR96311.1 rSAM-modified peptide [Porphyromonas gingivalis]RRD59502.1 rSAM-modified peptide [Tannerella forsythia]
MKLQKIKLNKLAENSLANREMKKIKGGNCCTCGCMYANSGGSSSTDNRNANHKNDLDSTYFGDYVYFLCTFP